MGVVVGTVENRVCGPEPASPETLYRLERYLGAGGQAHVWQGHAPGDPGRKVTVRFWKPNPGDPRGPAERRQSWSNGVQVLKRLRGLPGIAQHVTTFESLWPWEPGTVPGGDTFPVEVL